MPLRGRLVHRMCSTLASPRARAQAEDEVRGLLRRALEPSLVRVKQLAIRPSGSVGVNLELSTGACSRDDLEAQAAAVIDALPWATGCSVISSVRQPSSFMGLSAPASLSKVGALVGISSCKGGVGKSTVSANLAFALAELGGRVGLLDADIHGPSLPSLVSLEPDALPVTRRADNKLLRPPTVGGVKLMSYGFIAKGASRGEVSAAVMRGPMVGKVVTQVPATIAPSRTHATETASGASSGS